MHEYICEQCLAMLHYIHGHGCVLLDANAGELLLKYSVPVMFDLVTNH